MKIPGITHLQFLVLRLLKDGEVSGQTIRAGLRRNAVRKSGPAFYQLMARLEDAHLVNGRYDQKVIDGQIKKERRYKLTGKGSKAWAATRAFYAEQVK
jgi:DNA-binding PadR family transcriptional regulator